MGTRKTLENMQTAIDNAYDSIEEMGGDVPQARNLVNLSGTIDDLQNSVIAGVRGTNDAYQSTGKSYTKGESCIYNNVVYTAKDAISAPAGEFDPSKWDESSLASLRSSISDISASVDGIFIPITPVQGSNNYQANYIRLYTRNNKKMADISIGIKNASTGDIKATYNSSLFSDSVVICGAGVLSDWEPIVIYITGGNVAVLGSKSATTYVCCGATVVLDS